MAVYIKLTSNVVDNQEKALSSYVDVLGFVKKMDVRMGTEQWWLTVAVFAQKIPMTMLFTEDLAAEHARLAALGVAFTMPLTPMPWGHMSVLNDTCGNLIALVQV